MRTKGLVLAALLGTAAAQTADARQVLRCNGSIVDPGLTVAEVLARCGQPDSRDVSSVPVRAMSLHGGSYVIGTASLEHWVYRRRGGQFPAHLTFDQGRLRHIELIYRR
jgi:hypothetical protein